MVEIIVKVSLLKTLGKETKWSDRGPTARNDEGNESTKQHLDTGEMKQRIIESKKKMQTFLLKGINFVGSEAEFKTMLKKVSELTFVIKDYKMEGNDAQCIAEFSSAQVKDATYAFQMHNETSKLKIVLQKQKNNLQNSTETELGQCLEEMKEKASDVLAKHQDQMDMILKRIDGTGHKNKVFMVVEDYSRKQEEEMEALQFKLQEMDKQKKEFDGFFKSTIAKLEEARAAKNVDTALNTICSAFKVECTRLRTALPMYANRTEIMSMVTKNQVSVLLGETGSGKSTQVAQYMYQAGLANEGLIVCTQPRKIAAISLATHVAQEMGSSVGQLVGYKVGMQIRKSHDTKIIYMTDHMLLNECLKDKNLSSYSCIIVDEAHERSIYTDLLLGMVKKCINNRGDLRVVVTSATIDPAVFVDYFGGSCPILPVSGRMFPVDVIWRDEDINDNYEQAAVEKTIQIHQSEERGDILTFLTSPLEVERCCTSFKEHLSTEMNFVCLPLHGRLQANEQQKVFDPPPNRKRKIVFATNSAETSITIPGIKFVIDTGVAKEMQFDPKKNISTLCVKNVTKSSADQRKGRAGRTEAGKCFRLYSAETYDKMERNSRPEILRVHLGHALLKLMELGVAPLEFDFVQAPPRALMDTAMATLEFVGAVANKAITDLGKWIAKLPLDPKYGAFVHEAISKNVGIEAMILSACCAAGGSIFYRSGTMQEKSKADKLKVRFCHEGGDLMTMLNVYREWHMQPEKTKGSWCSANSINGKAIRDIRETVNEVLNILTKEPGTKLKFELNSPHEVDIKLQKMLFKTFRRNICYYLGHEKAGYTVVEKDQQVHLFPASSLKSLGLQPDWLVFEQVLKTSRHFAINVTTVSHEWILEALEKEWLQIDLENAKRQRVDQMALFEVGEHVYKDFVGIRHSKLREIKESMKSKNNMMIIEASKQLGEIVVYSQQNCGQEYTNLIRDRIACIKQKMQQEKIEQVLSSSNSGVRVIVGAGLNIVDVLMSDEYKTIFVTGIPNIIEAMTEDDMVETFQKFGKIGRIDHFRNSKNKNNWGKITFEKKEEAELAVRMMNGNLDVGARPSIGFRSANIFSFRSKLQWCRRPSRCFGFVRFSNAILATRSFTNHVSVGGTIVRIKPSKSNSAEVHVSNLNPHVDEDVLRQGFENTLGLDPNEIERVTVIRKKVVNASPDLLQTFRQCICRKIEEYVKEGNYELDLRNPKEADFTYLAFVSFSKPEEGLAACTGIDHSFVMNSEVVSMKADLKSSVMIPKLIYAKYKHVVTALINRLSKTERAIIKQKELKNENVVMDIHTDNIETMITVKNDILSAIKGQIMSVESTEDIGWLFTWDGRRLIKTVMENTEITIVADERILSISVHGFDRNKDNAIEMLTEYLKELKSGKTIKLSLRRSDKPPGVMKELMLRYEFDLNKLKMDTGLKCVELDHRFHVVTIIGDSKTVEQCISLVEKVIEDVRKKHEMHSLEPAKERNCGICFCPIEEDKIHRLESCGHSYCKECVELQFKSAVKNNSFPILCSMEECAQPWVWKDISNLAVKTGIPVAVLVSKATNTFVTQNKKEYRYCPTADCPIIYRVSEKEKLFSCTECEIRICTACHNQFHDGLTCKIVETKKTDDSGLKLWMEENAARAKYCPQCSTPIEKTDGCNHMECLGCKAHICWVCLEYLTTGQECYGHMQEIHHSFM